MSNPVGYVPIFDGGNARVISGKARENISGGMLVAVSGAADVVSSGANSFNPATDLLFAKTGSGTVFTGVAINDAASGSTISVATRGTIIGLAADTVTAGTTVVANGTGFFTATTDGQIVGRALTSAGSEGYALIDLNP